jgi:hypothetical protein
MLKYNIIEAKSSVESQNTGKVCNEAHCSICSAARVPQGKRQSIGLKSIRRILDYVKKFQGCIAKKI